MNARALFVASTPESIQNEMGEDEEGMAKLKRRYIEMTVSFLSLPSHFFWVILHFTFACDFRQYKFTRANIKRSLECLRLRIRDLYILRHFR